ncbi:proteinrelated to nucleosome binding protein [Purpureocillium lilacinum]|uniref:Proteinrelated to nucleosome binding protein n=1 Tax=Purpureocillium lilacinum TaxID=33203 RepID=A0A179H167_PURLI|nr:proteinrelated to nucleosome binding protein [Purpureocillium lilacinum]OAQ83221.1 proteinrelated to nucleosome binding protein [Purpureocillium lilacinum]
MADDEPVTAAVAHPLRILLAGCFIPAFPLCVAHGVLSSSPVPAVGLVPQAVSVVSSLLLLRVRTAPSRDAEHQAGHGTLANGERAHDGDDHPHDEEHDDEDDDEPRHVLRETLSNPIVVFLFDVLLAASYMIVLVFTWISPSRSPSLSMLAAYATIPLLTSFFGHLFLALRALYDGLAVRGLVRYVAWRAVPPDCPHCSARLRPAQLPEFPWLRALRTSYRRLRLHLRRRRADDGYTPVFVSETGRYRDDDDDDEPRVDHDGGAGRAPGDDEVRAEQPEAVDVRSRERRGKKSAQAAPEDAAPWGNE